jgi:hypothetical protein
LARLLGREHSPRWNEKAGLRGMRYAPDYVLAVQKETDHEEA